LRAQGLRTFFDRKDLRPGLSWLAALEDTSSRAGLFFMAMPSISRSERHEEGKCSIEHSRSRTWAEQEEQQLGFV
jgi:hypothetical protein